MNSGVSPPKRELLPEPPRFAPDTLPMASKLFRSLADANGAASSVKSGSQRGRPLFTSLESPTSDGDGVIT